MTKDTKIYRAFYLDKTYMNIKVSGSEGNAITSLVCYSKPLIWAIYV